jgi:hypothetical protein
MTPIGSADTSAPRSYTLRGFALLATASMVAAVSLLALPLNARAATAAASHPSVAVPSVAVPSVASGKLAPQGCTASGTTDTCNLYAMAGTNQVLGTPINIWGFSSTGVAGSATAPGPLLVVNQGDTVTVRLHNLLAGQNVSLAFPGQPTSAFTAGLSTQAEDVGLAPRAATDPDATLTYTFSAARPGTFIYEAGHTANGTRQVAMGLAGALVVRPADGTAYGVVTDYPDTAYDDDAVVVLSEIDPALNAAPATFDMRSFAPKYRLINGKPFPSTDPISTDQGHRVLLRYVNVGSQDHSMSLLGADQTQVAQDGHAMKYAETEVAMAVIAGATADTVVTMPTGPESKISLYEAAGRLDNNGQSTADPLSLAFGGMLTFLDTAAPPPSNDIVGPVSSHVTASPNPSNGLADVTITADLSDATTGATPPAVPLAVVDQAEFVIDDAATVAPGSGTAMTGGFGSVDVPGATGVINVATLTALAAGKHTVFVRAHDSAGNWGVVGGVIFNLPKTGPQTTNGSATPSPANGTLDVAVSATGDDSTAGGNIDGAEYFLDTLGAAGTGTSITPNRVATVVSLDATIPAGTVLGLSEGTHHVFVRSHDSLGLWGPTLDIPLPVDKTGPAVLGADVTPNPTNGILTLIAHPGYVVVSASISDASSGALPVTDAEGFLDTIGAGGTGFQLAATDGAMDQTTESVMGLIPISQIKALSNGTHHVSVRGQDSAGNWGPVLTMNLSVDKVAPVLGTVVGTPNPTNGAANLALTAPISENTIGLAEFWLGTTDPGIGKATSVAFTAGSSIVATVPLAGIVPGSYLFNLRVKDTAGNWSNAVRTAAITVTRQNPIFSNGFSSTTSPFGWFSSTGGPTVTAAAGIPVGVGNNGLQVTLPGGTTNGPRYVTDTTPSVETSYHASFAFNANTLNSGTNAGSVLTLFEAQTGAGGQVLAVQFHRTLGVGAVNQIRMVFPRSTGGTFTSPYVNLPAGNHTLQVDWVAGPATGANPGSLRLLLDGASIASQTGNTGTRTVETALLGLTAGTTNSMTGTAYFDTFSSTRFTLP